MVFVRETVDPDARALRVVVSIRRIDVAAVVSVLLHALFFLLAPVKPPPDTQGPISDQPLNVVLAPPQAEPAPVPTPQPPSVPTAAIVPRHTQPPVITRPPSPLAPRFPPPPITAPTSPEPAPPPEPAVDMMAAIEARRSQRRATESALARGAPSQANSPQDALNRNLQSLSGREGVGGVFQVLRKGVRTGEFAFNGFRNEGMKQWREVIEVDAGVGGDVELAMIRRMIELIRTHYQGDFQWESHRLGRVVVLSARVPDQPGLEEFLMKEFFGAPPTPPARR
jgi:hypothetical protein